MKKHIFILIGILLFGSMPFFLYASDSYKPKFLYTTYFGKTFRFLFSSRWITIFFGWCADRSWSAYFIPWFIKKYKIPMNEAARTKSTEYRTFNDFFSRTLTKNARPIDSDPSSCISPADGILYIFEHITEHTFFVVKETPLNLEKLLGKENAEQAQEFIGGTLFLIYLAPYNYHRFHFPISCTPGPITHINGTYQSVAPFVYNFIQPLTENERHFVQLTPNMIMVAVGAMGVGKITWTYQQKNSVSKGTEAGYFSFGGSTILLLCKKGTCYFEEKYKNKEKKFPDNGYPIKMGEKIGRLL